MPKACRVPTSGSDSGKYSFAKTSPVTVLYRKKSYHSIVVPIVLAITARRNCTRCSNSESALVAVPATAIIETPPPSSPQPILWWSRAGPFFLFYYLGELHVVTFGLGRALAAKPEQAHAGMNQLWRETHAANQTHRADDKGSRKGGGFLQRCPGIRGDSASPERRRFPDRRLHQSGDPELEDRKICRRRRQRAQLQRHPSFRL